MSSTKRSFNEVVPFDSEPPIKRRKLNLPSTLFPHPSDQQQFRSLFGSIDASILPQTLQIGPDVIKEIAEFATGDWKNCGNQDCAALISVLSEDAAVYDNDHGNATKIRYKYLENTYFCSECMCCVEEHKCTVCWSKYLCHTQTNAKCHGCGCFHHEQCQSFSSRCMQCGCDGALCFYCNMTSRCVVCHTSVCNRHTGLTNHGYLTVGQNVCTECYELGIESRMRCGACNTSFLLLHESLKVAYQEGTEQWELCSPMKKCAQQGCDVWVCFNCEPESRPGGMFGRLPFCQEHHLETC